MEILILVALNLENIWQVYCNKVKYRQSRSRPSASCQCFLWSGRSPHRAEWSTSSCRWFPLWWCNRPAGRLQTSVWSAWLSQSLDQHWRTVAWRPPAYGNWSWQFPKWWQQRICKIQLHVWYLFKNATSDQKKHLNCVFIESPLTLLYI